MPFVVKGTPISAPQTGLWQQSSKSFVLRDCDHLFFTFTSMDSELKRWEARQQLILMCWKAMSDRSGNLHQTSRPDLGRDVWTRSGTLPQTSQLNYESPLNRRLVFFAYWFLRALVGAHLKSAFKNNCSSRPRCQIARAWQTQSCKSLFAKPAHFVFLATAHTKYFL